MANDDWRDYLRGCLEELDLVEKQKRQTLEDFNHFYEFIAEPAFESLGQELRSYKIRTKYRLDKGRTVHFRINFPGSGIDHFHYDLILPRNSIELRLRLCLKGRKSMKSVLETREEPFLARVLPAEILKISKEALIRDIIEHYRDFRRRAQTSPL